MSLAEIPLIEDLRPIVITPTRYGGTYEGAQFLCIPSCDASINDLFPEAFNADQEVCLTWWADKENHKFFGKGETPTEALQDMLRIWYPQSDTVELDEDFCDIDEALRQARYDTVTLLTSYAAAVGAQEFNDSAELHNEIVNRWAEDDVSPLVAILVGVAVNLVQIAAEATDTTDLKVIQKLALDMEMRHNGELT